MEVYILKGSAGEWEDRDTWTVGGFYLMDEALDKQAELNRCMDGMQTFGSWMYDAEGYPPEDWDEVAIDNGYKCMVFELRKLDTCGCYSEHEMPLYFIETLEVS